MNTQTTQTETNPIHPQTSTETQTPAESHPHTSALGWRESARLGKIARLPWGIREELNERLADNEPAERLLRWLNAEPEVQEVLEYQFDGRPITKQNLSAWKLGGYRDWERGQEARARMRAFLTEADQVCQETAEDEDGEEMAPLLDRVGDRIALGLLELFQEVELSEKGPRRTREMLEIARELARLRRAGQQQQRMQMMEERFQREQDEADEKEIKAREKEVAELDRKIAQAKLHEVSFLSAYTALFRTGYLRELAAGTLTPAKEQSYRDFFAKVGPRLAELGISGLPEGEELKIAVAAMRKQLRREAAEAKAKDRKNGGGQGAQAQGKTQPVKPGQG